MTRATNRGRALRAGAVAAACALSCLAFASAAAAADFGIASFDGAVSNRDGSPATGAASHPFEASTTIRFDSTVGPEGRLVPNGSVKDIEIELPAGFVGDPQAAPRCAQGELLDGFNNCPIGSQVGLIEVTIDQFLTRRPVHNMVPPPGVPAMFAFQIEGQTLFLKASVRTDGDYGVTTKLNNISQAVGFHTAKVILWGTPADPVHDPDRGACIVWGGLDQEGNPCHSSAPKVPFLTNPTACVGPVRTTMRADSWQQPGAYREDFFISHDNSTPPAPLGANGCDDVPFEPTAEVRPDTSSADSPTGLDVDLHLPQRQNVDGLAQAHLKSAVVTLPVGMAVNPAAAAGLGACTASQIGLGTMVPATCPDSAKLGDVEIETPLLDHPLEGGVYLARQGENKFGALLAVYIAVNDPQSGIVIKLPGRIETDSKSGRLTASFDDNPQLPFEDLHVDFYGGPRAALITPPSCGTYSTTARLAPWSGTPPVSSISSFRITSGPGGGPCPSGAFAPKLAAGSTDPLAGRYSPFVLSLSREDGSQRLRSLSVTLPPGLLGKLKGVPYCPDSALAGVPGAEGSGAAQLGSPSCPAASRVGTASVWAGAGPSPFNVDTGRVYLGGPYKGAPLSLAIVTPALAGPFDLGNVVVRAALVVDAASAQITAVSDPLPTILHGIPLDLREVRVAIDRDGFTLNPTSCDPMAVRASVSSLEGKTASPSDRFQVASCERLAFKPKLSLDLKGGTRRGAYPALKAVLTAKPGQANVNRVSVALPHSEFLAQEHIKTICTKVQFAAEACPKGSIYGYAKATTPLLDQPLQGPVYLRSSNNPLPDLVAALDGQIEIDLSGRIDSVRGGIRTSFETVPDAPISRFVLTMKGGKKSLLVNSRNLCASTNKAKVLIDGQNGKTADQSPVLTNSCGKKSSRRR